MMLTINEICRWMNASSYKKKRKGIISIQKQNEWSIGFQMAQ